jgi:integrase
MRVSGDLFLDDRFGKSGVSQPFPPDDLRRTFASCMKQGEDSAVVATRLGHREQKTVRPRGLCSPLGL